MGNGSEIVDKKVLNTFYLYGVGVLIAWNAILSDLDFFQNNVKGFKIY